jgi:oligoribonuclease (3'-5' exoribonuclease)
MALGLPRSTTWTLLVSNHKASGLSATVINRMLAAAQLPPLVRARIFEYVDEKTAGLYGHSKIQLRRFAARLAPESVVDSQTKLAAASQKAG